MLGPRVRCLLGGDRGLTRPAEEGRGHLRLSPPTLPTAPPCPRPQPAQCPTERQGVRSYLLLQFRKQDYNSVSSVSWTIPARHHCHRRSSMSARLRPASAWPRWGLGSAWPGLCSGLALSAALGPGSPREGILRPGRRSLSPQPLGSPSFLRRLRLSPGAGATQGRPRASALPGSAADLGAQVSLGAA